MRGFWGVLEKGRTLPIWRGEIRLRERSTELLTSPAVGEDDERKRVMDNINWRNVQEKTGTDILTIVAETQQDWSAAAERISEHCEACFDEGRNSLNLMNITMNIGTAKIMFLLGEPKKAIELLNGALLILEAPHPSGD